MTAPPVKRSSPRRLAAAFALTPFLPCFYCAIFFAQPWALPVGLAVSYPAELVVGVPTILFMRTRGWMQWWQLAIAGTLCALPVIAAYAWMQDVPHIEPFSVMNAVFVALWGAFSGLCFWLLGVCGETPFRFRNLFDVGSD